MRPANQPTITVVGICHKETGRSMFWLLPYVLLGLKIIHGAHIVFVYFGTDLKKNFRLKQQSSFV